jgi:glycosyltransferase involved in cell wall biosynthesis
LSECDKDNEYQLYVPKGLFGFKKKFPNFNVKNFISRVDRFNRGPARTLKNVDVYHCPSPGPLEAPIGAKIIVTVHDVIIKAFPDGHTQQTIETGLNQFEELKDKASKIICCSKSTVHDLKRFFQVPDEKIALVYQGVDKEIFYTLKKDDEWIADQWLTRIGVKAPFLLSVGTIEPRKNLINCIHAFNRLRVEGKFLGTLVIVGMKGWMRSNIETLIDELKLRAHIVFLGYISDRELCYLYNKTEVFVFPSFYEGFGFPIVEAFCCGAPVVTSNVSSCPEIAADAALTVNPSSIGDIAEAINRIIQDHALRDSLKGKGSKRAGDFDFRKTACETLKVYEEVCGV